MGACVGLRPLTTPGMFLVDHGECGEDINTTANKHGRSRDWVDDLLMPGPESCQVEHMPR